MFCRSMDFSLFSINTCSAKNYRNGNVPRQLYILDSNLLPPMSELTKKINVTHIQVHFVPYVHKRIQKIKLQLLRFGWAGSFLNTVIPIPE